MNYFEYLHPLTKATYYGMLFICIMIVASPLSMLLSILALMGILKRNGVSTAMNYKGFFAVLALSIIGINFLFNHRGTHILFYLLDRPMTLEALLYGCTSAMMIVSIVLLFQNASYSIKTREFLYLFGGIMPQIGLLISMTCGFFQMLTDRGQDIQQALRMKDIEIGRGTINERSYAGMQIMHVLIALTLENALITVLSMKSRAFDIGPRTSGLVYKLRARDILFMGFSLTLAGAMLLMWGFGIYRFSIYPSIDFSKDPALALLFYALNFAMLGLPFYKAGSYKKKLLLQKEGL